MINIISCNLIIFNFIKFMCGIRRVAWGVKEREMFLGLT